jgi:energy-coupling factor transport system permease protein
LLCCVGLAIGGRRVHRTAYRPDPWRWPEWIVAGGGIACAVILFVGVGYDAADLNPSPSPLTWPPVPIVPVVGILLAGLAALAAPPPVRHRPAPRAKAAPQPVRERVSA